MGTGAAVRLSVLVLMLVMSRIVSRTRSSMRNRDSFQAKRERNMVLWREIDMLSDKRERMCEGL